MAKKNRFLFLFDGNKSSDSATTDYETLGGLRRIKTSLRGVQRG